MICLNLKNEQWQLSGGAPPKIDYHGSRVTMKRDRSRPVDMLLSLLPKVVLGRSLVRCGGSEKYTKDGVRSRRLCTVMMPSKFYLTLWYYRTLWLCVEFVLC